MVRCDLKFVANLIYLNDFCDVIRAPMRSKLMRVGEWLHISVSSCGKWGQV